MNEYNSQASQPRLTTNILSNTLLILKNGSFYSTYKEDAIILNFILKYKIFDEFRVGFPEMALTKVINALEEKKIDY